MASSGKKKTTMAKLTRESRLRERRLDKQAKKDARKNAPAESSEQPGGGLEPTLDGSGESEPSPAGVEPLAQVPPGG
jgi:hypothetical protein